jgi:hypothetical protein
MAAGQGLKGRSGYRLQIVGLPEQDFRGLSLELSDAGCETKCNGLSADGQFLR